MFTTINIVEKLNFFDITCDINDVEKLIQQLHIEPINISTTGEKLYDDNTYEQIKNNLTFKQYEFATNNAELVNETKTAVTTKTKNIELLATTLSEKVTNDLKDYIKNNLYTEEALKTGYFKHDNEILSQKLQEVITENKKLIKQIQDLEKENRKYHLLFSNIYIKEK